MNESLYRGKFDKTSVPLGDELDILREQFKVACERAEAWKKLALAVRKEYGKVAELLGTASGTLFRIGNRWESCLPQWLRDEVLDLDKKITATMKSANIPIPEILEGEV